LRIDGKVKTAILIGGEGLLVHSALFAITPDVWSAALVLGAWAVLLNPRYPSSRKHWLLAGVTLASAYFAKHYNLVYFGFILLVGLFLTLPFKSLRQYRKGLAVSFVIFVCSVAPWIIALSHKYDSVTISRAGAYNYQLIAYHNNTQAFERLGLMPPSCPNSTSAWEEITLQPSVQAEMRNLAGEAAPNSLASTVWRNCWILGHFATYRGLVVLIPFLLLLIWQCRKSNPLPLIILALASVYIVGYVVVLFEDRYVLPAYLALAVAAGYYIQDHLTKSRQLLALTLLPMCLGGWSLSKVIEYRYDNKPEAQAATDFAQQGLRLRDQAVGAWPGHWHLGLEMSYRLGAHFWGQPAIQTGDYDPSQIIDSLAAKVSYVILSPDTVTALTQSNLPRWQSGGIAIYQLR
jgi:hypothetical protein